VIEPTVPALAFLVAILSLDNTALGQVMVSQPLVGGWLMGAAVGRPLEGLGAGTLLQLLCMTELRVGASIPPDGSLAGLTGVALFLGRPDTGPWTDLAVLGAAVLLFFPVAYGGRWAEIVVLRLNRRWTLLAGSFLDEGRGGWAQLARRGGRRLFFAKAFFISLFSLLLVRGLLANAGDGASWLLPLFEALARVAPFAGLGVVAARQRQGAGAAPALVGFAAGALLYWGIL